MAVAWLEHDAEVLCGQRYERKQVGQGYRGGHEQTSVVVEGAKYAIRRPRVRRDNREVESPILAKLQQQDLLNEQMRQRMVAGREYPQLRAGNRQL